MLKKRKEAIYFFIGYMFFNTYMFLVQEKW